MSTQVAELGEARTRSLRWGLPIGAGLLLSLAIPMAFFEAPFWWMSVGLFAAAGVLVFRVYESSKATFVRWSEQSLSTKLRLSRKTFLAEILCIAALFAVTSAQFRTAIWDRIISDDHAIHFFRAWLFEAELLSEGRIRGWVQGWYAGYPQNYLYPFGADLWVVAVRAVTLGALSLSTAYAIAVWLMWTLFGYAHYRLGTVFANRPVGLAAALLAITDIGGGRSGGWHQFVEVGVWPQALSVAFCVLALARAPRLLSARSYRDVAAFGLLMGLGLLSHPMALFFFAVAIPALLLVRAASQESESLRSLLVALALGSTVGVAIAALYVLPMLSVADQMMKTGVAWHDVHTFGAKAMRGHVIAGMWPFVFVLGCVGTIAAFFERRTHRRLLGLFVVVLFALAVGSIVSEFHIDAVFKSLRQTQFERYLILAKPAFLVLAASAGGRALGLIGRRRNPAGESNAPQTIATATIAFFAVTLAAPMAGAFLGAYADSHVFRKVTTESRRPHAAERAKLIDWLESNMPAEGFYRLGMRLPTHELDLPVDLEKPYYTPVARPASVFRHRIRGGSARTYTAIGVRYFIDKKNLRKRNFRKLNEFGPYKVYALKEFDPAIFTVDGGGDVTLTRFEDETIELRAGPNARGTLLLHYAPFPRWQATRDGHAVPISPRRFDKGVEFMSVPLEPGVYRFEFKRSFIDHLASVLAALGLLAAIFLILLDTNIGRLARVRARFEALRGQRSGATGFRSALVRTALASMVVPAGTALAAWTPLDPLLAAQGQTARRPVYDFGRNLRHATARTRRLVCEWSLDHYDCGGKTLGFGFHNIERYKIGRCIRVPLGKEQPIELVYTKLPAGSVLAGFFSANRKAAKARLRIEIDGKVAFDGRASRLHPEFFSVEAAGLQRIVFRVSSRKRRGAMCFNAQLLR